MNFVVYSFRINKSHWYGYMVRYGIRKGLFEWYIFCDIKYFFFAKSQHILRKGCLSEAIKLNIWLIKKLYDNPIHFKAIYMIRKINAFL